MARKYRKNYVNAKLIENAIILIYLIYLIYFIFTKVHTLSGWIIFLITTLIFPWLIISLKIYRSAYWIGTHIIERFFFTALYKIGLGKPAVKLINVVNDEKLQEDKDYKTYMQYWDRKKVFGRVLHKEYMTIGLDIGKDALYIGKHFIHQKKKQIALQDNAMNNKQLHDLSGIDFENLLFGLFVAMGYTVQKTGKVSDQSCDLILNLGEQKLLLKGIHLKDKPVEVVSLLDALATQKQYVCNGTMIISLSNFTSEASEFAKSNNIGLVGKERLIELLAQYLNEYWN